MDLSLVILAAGMGSRYGGPKQLDAVGPGGATLLDYAAYDAWRAGFTRVVLVVREAIEGQVRERVGSRIDRRLPVSYAVQDRALPPGFVPAEGRTKPWGTGHAALAAARHIQGPFAVVNGDDFYGAGSYEVLAPFLRQGGSTGEAHALVAFPLETTLSEEGPVSRGVCEVDASSCLVSVREVFGLVRDGEGVRGQEGDGTSRLFSPVTPVSLNFWGFSETFRSALESGFARFLAAEGSSTRAEYFLPAVVQETMRTAHARVRVLTGGGPWSGLTHPGDRPRLVALLRHLVDAGEYPEDLWA